MLLLLMLMPLSCIQARSNLGSTELKQIPDEKCHAERPAVSLLALHWLPTPSRCSPDLPVSLDGRHLQRGLGFPLVCLEKGGDEGAEHVQVLPPDLGPATRRLYSDGVVQPTAGETRLRNLVIGIQAFFSWPRGDPSISSQHVPSCFLWMTNSYRLAAICIHINKEGFSWLLYLQTTWLCHIMFWWMQSYWHVTVCIFIIHCFIYCFYLSDVRFLHSNPEKCCSDYRQTD